MKQGQSYWFYLSPKVYVEKKQAVLLYHTKSGERLMVRDEFTLSLIDSVQHPMNLGVVQLPQEFYSHTEAQRNLEQIITLGMGGLIPIERDKPKPINFLPILNLQKDVEKAKSQGELSLVLDDLLGYLSKCIVLLEGNSPLCRTYLHRSIVAPSDTLWMSRDLLVNLLEQTRHSRLRQVGLYADNLFEHPEFEAILQSLDNYDLDYQLYLSASHYIRHKEIIHQLIQVAKSSFATTLICSVLELEQILATSKVSQDKLRLEILIESEGHYALAIETMERYGYNEYECIPIYTGSNLGFFEENIYLSEDDIFSEPIEMRSIFCNQKLNSNNFGCIVVSPEGFCKASPHSETVGNLKDMTILEFIYKELVQNTSWRKTRNYPPCVSCMYQYICPSPSCYEEAIGRGNLCHLM